MAMFPVDPSLTGEVFAEGQLPNTKTTLYTCPAGVTAYVLFLRLYNSGAGGNTCRVYFKRGTSRVMGRAVLATLETAEVIDKDAPLTLEAGDLIEGDATNATEVDYVITGATG